jgi:hypothetical protein
VHDNRLYTPDGKIADVCGETTEQRHISGKDPGTTVMVWPSTDDLLHLLRERMNLSTATAVPVEELGAGRLEAQLALE